MSVTPETSAVPTPVSAGTSAEFGRAAMAILVTMVLLMVALTGILVETTWRQPDGEVEVLPPDPGSFAQR
jgi:hypothetical protein